MEILKPVVGFRLKDGEQEIEVLDQPRRLIAEAAARYELQELAAGQAQTGDAVELEAMSLLLSERYGELRALFSHAGSGAPPGLRDAVAWSYIGEGNALQAQAERAEAGDAARLFGEAGAKYAEALRSSRTSTMPSTTGATRSQAQAEGPRRARPRAVRRGGREVRGALGSSRTSTRRSTTGATRSRRRPKRAEAAARRRGCSARPARSTPRRSRSSRTITRRSTTGAPAGGAGGAGRGGEAASPVRRGRREVRQARFGSSRTSTRRSTTGARAPGAGEEGRGGRGGATVRRGRHEVRRGAPDQAGLSQGAQQLGRYVPSARTAQMQPFAGR